MRVLQNAGLDVLPTRRLVVLVSRDGDSKGSSTSALHSLERGDEFVEGGKKRSKVL